VSNVTKGKQMVPVINAIGVHAAVYGNHDFGKSPHTFSTLYTCIFLRV